MPWYLLLTFNPYRWLAWLPYKGMVLADFVCALRISSYPPEKTCLGGW